MSSDSDDDKSGIERVVCTVKEVFAYKIPPPSSEGYFAANWKEQIYVGSVRVLVKDDEGRIELYNHKDGSVFATAFLRDGEVPYESVKDSSRYFALKIESKNGKKAYVGLGFQERTDAFDFNVSCQDFIKSVKEGGTKEEEVEEEAVDYTLKDGEKLNINVSVKTKGSGIKMKKSEIKASGGALAPPPSNTGGRRGRKGAAPSQPVQSEINLMQPSQPSQPMQSMQPMQQMQPMQPSQPAQPSLDDLLGSAIPQSRPQPQMMNQPPPSSNPLDFLF